jgi:hypothetical protein
MVIKISTDYKQLGQEIQALRGIHEVNGNLSTS